MDFVWEIKRLFFCARPKARISKVFLVLTLFSSSPIQTVASCDKAEKKKTNERTMLHNVFENIQISLFISFFLSFSFEALQVLTWHHFKPQPAHVLLI